MYYMYEYYFQKIRNQRCSASRKVVGNIVIVLFLGPEFWYVSPNDSIFMANLGTLFDFEEKITFFFF